MHEHQGMMYDLVTTASAISFRERSGILSFLTPAAITVLDMFDPDISALIDGVEIDTHA